MQERPVRKGDEFVWHGVEIRVARVAKDATWADIIVWPAAGPGWTKRQPLPFPADFVAVSS